MEIPKTAKKIEGSKDYIDIDGSVYSYISNYKGKLTDKVIKKTQHKCFGYLYCGIYYYSIKKTKSMRVHRLVANAFLPNPNQLPIVGHKNNIKCDNRIENLYWTTSSENTQKTIDDGLLINDKGINDSQSKPVIMYNTTTNEKIAQYGSISEAVRETGISKTTIARQAKYHRPVRKPYYFRYVDDYTAIDNKIIGKFDYDTDTLLETFYNIGEASRRTKMCEKTISYQCNNGKPKIKNFNIYFGYVNSKCEQTIENIV